MQFTQGTQLNNLPISLSYTTNVRTHSKNHPQSFIVLFFFFLLFTRVLLSVTVRSECVLVVELFYPGAVV